MQKTPTRLHDTSKIASKGNSYVILAISKMHEGLQLKFSKLRVQEKKYQDNDVDVVFEIVSPVEGLTDHVYADMATLASSSGGRVVQN